MPPVHQLCAQLVVKAQDKAHEELARKSRDHSTYKTIYKLENSARCVHSTLAIFDESTLAKKIGTVVGWVISSQFLNEDNIGTILVLGSLNIAETASEKDDKYIVVLEEGT